MSNADQPAFPAMDMNQYSGVDRLELKYEGLTKREYFAAMAMQGLLAYVGLIDGTKDVASSAVECADYLLRQLETTK